MDGIPRATRDKCHDIDAYAEDTEFALQTVHAIAREYAIDNATVQLESTVSNHFISNPEVSYFYSPTNRGLSYDGVSFLLTNNFSSFNEK